MDQRIGADTILESGRAGRAAAAAVAAGNSAAARFDEIASTFRGRRMAIEIGCGDGQVLLGHAGIFERLRGVDARPAMLARLEARAAELGAGDVQGFLLEEQWDWPTGAADYVYCSGMFQYMEDLVELATIIQRISGVLRRNGIAHLQFDTRPRTLPYRASRYLPDRVLPRDTRRGVRSIRREPEWVWERLRGADLQVFGHQNFRTAYHWFVARRR